MNLEHCTTEHFTPIHTQIEDAVLDGQPVLRIIKKDKIECFDENTCALLNNIQLHNGTIEVRIRSRLLPDAPDFARGFVGIVFRAKADASEFESFYIRPTNGRSCTDLIRKTHGCQYFSYPGYTFSYFREFGITEFESPVDIDLDEWITLCAVIHNETASFYLNHASQPVLTVSNMKHGIGQSGFLGIYVDIGTEAFVSDVKVTLE